MASYYAQQVPRSIEEFVDGAEREALSRYPAVLKTLSELAVNGSVEAIKVFARELAGPRRPSPRKQSSMTTDLSLNLAIQNLIQPPPRGRPVNSSLPVEGGPTQASNGQISSNSALDLESIG
jgi:hypothetical protein